MTTSAADMTIDEIADAIRQCIADDPLLAGLYRPVADRLAATLRDRLPYLDPADIGAVVMCVGCWLADSLALLRKGLDAEVAGQTAANMVAMAGERLYRVPAGGAK